MAIDPLTNSNDCGCCAGLGAETPVAINNRAGLSAIAYRAGTHAQFKGSMLAALSSSSAPALRALKARDDDDFSIALLDAWATVADVLTFYQERIANESYLRTATERLSALELARLIGYELRPGVAANTYLAFTLEDAPGAFGQAINLSNIARGAPEAPPPITIDAGAKAQSVPGPGEQPATFETVEAIEARVEWNALKPRLAQPQQLSLTMGSIVFQGTTTNLRPGDKLLITITPAGGSVRTILNVAVDDEAQTTRVDFENPALSPAFYQRPGGLSQGKPTDFPAQTPLNESAVQAIIAKRWSEEDLEALAKMQNWPLASLLTNINKQASSTKFTGGTGVFAFRQRAAIFGHNAPKWDSLPANLRFDTSIAKYKQDVNGNTVIDKLEFVQAAFPAPGWEDRRLENDGGAVSNSRFVFLDNVYPNIVKGGWLVLSSRTVAPQAFAITDHIETSRSDFSISAKVSRLTITASSLNAFRMRETAALVQSEALSLTEAPIRDVVQGDNITLDRAYLGLKKGQKVILTGERDDLKGVTSSELLTIKEVIFEKGFTVLVFKTALAGRYVRRSVTINANVARSTHGETAQETLGSGDATQAFQRFTLRQPPLTHTSAPTPSGTASTLQIRANDLLWREAPSLYGHGPDERIFITRLGDDGKTTVQFGDGVTGARLPTGQENVRATYRKGIGRGGLVKAEQISLLLTRPLGVKGVINPLASAGAADAETLEDVRRNAPLTIMTLDRIVSLKDYEDFARAYAGIAKALATWTWNGQARGVFVTVAGPDGAEVKADSDLYKNLLDAMRLAGDPYVSLRVQSYAKAFFRLAARVKTHPDYLPEKVLAAVEQALRERFSFDARQFGQPVALSEVVAVMQSAPGVVAVDLDKLYRFDDTAAGLNALLPAAAPQAGDKGTVAAAELLTLDPSPLHDLGVMP